MAQASPQLQTSSLPLSAGQTVLQCDCDAVGVLVLDGHRRLIAVRDIAKGARVFYLEGHETAVPTRYSVQVGEGLHIDEGGAVDEFDVVRRYYWRFLDHACEPSARIVGRELFAVRDIAAGEAVTFHYCTTEWDMASPFACHCGSPRCLGTIRGAKHLPADERRRLAKWMADYLK